MNLPHHPSRGGRLTRVLRESSLALTIASGAVLASAQEIAGGVAGEVEDLTAVGTNDPYYIMPVQPLEGAFGFSKSLLETPRTVSVVSSEMIDKMGLSAVEDLVRVVPGVFTLTRYGIQGGMDVRDVSADIYFRGMKRLNMEGFSRTVLAAMDTIEVVKGPPSPIYGMGKIGGYNNMVPKSGRAKTGAYLERAQGFTQAIIGTYDRTELTFGYGGPLTVGSKRGGFYVFGLFEDSGTFVEGVPIRTRMGQASISLDDVVGNFRLEAGINVQSTLTAGAVLGRVTQEMIDTGRYIRGTPLVQLDLNGNGAIGYRELHAASPVRGNISGNNTPLLQRFALPRDSSGNPIPLDQVPAVPGIPEAFYNYLVANPEHDPSGILRAQGIGGPLPLSGYIPVGMFLDPLTIGFDTMDVRRAGAYERGQEGGLVTFYADLINDENPDFTIKNQIFFDGIDAYKISDMGLYSKRRSYVWEDKITVMKRLSDGMLPEWMRVNALASLNFRKTTNDGRRRGSFISDPSANRVDVMAPTWISERGGATPNTTFVSSGVNTDLENDGLPGNTSSYGSFWETGLGVLLDIDIAQRLNLLIGGRIDGSEAKFSDYGGAFNIAAGTSANPGRFSPAVTTTTEGWDSGTSWSVSLSYQLPYNIRPYATISESSLALDSSSNGISATVIRAGHIGQAEIKEAGVKTTLLENRLFFTAAVYEQSRLNVASPDDPTATAEVTSTIGTGWETELKWVPSRTLFLSLFARNQKTIYSPNTGSNIAVNARALGFRDILDANGNVIFPAEAFLYGGRAEIILPAGLEEYEEQQGRPKTQLGFNANLEVRRGVALTLSGNYFASVYSGRLRTLKLPEHTIYNAGVSWNVGQWDLKLDVFNFLDERSFRSMRLASGEVLAIANPDRRFQLTVRTRF